MGRSAGVEALTRLDSTVRWRRPERPAPPRSGRGSCWVARRARSGTLPPPAPRRRAPHSRCASVAAPRRGPPSPGACQGNNRPPNPAWRGRTCSPPSPRQLRVRGQASYRGGGAHLQGHASLLLRHIKAPPSHALATSPPVGSVQTTCDLHRHRWWAPQLLEAPGANRELGERSCGGPSLPLLSLLSK
eukprot:scaffold624_cov402-Prasinococcus_capsulatus_cf.AAC.49